MKVDDANDRAEMPEECDFCNSQVKLTRFIHYGPGYQVDWLCRYCALIFGKPDSTAQTMAAMFNELEQALQGEKVEKDV